MRQIIELDAAPGMTRPNVLLHEVLHDIQHDIPIREPNTTSFGCWVFDYTDIDTDVWKRHNPVIGERIRALFTCGRIRYGAWS